MKKQDIEKEKVEFATKCVEFTIANFFNGKLAGLKPDEIVALYSKKPVVNYSAPRTFRLKCRGVSKDHRKGKVLKHRDYVNLEKLTSHGRTAYNRYNRPDSSYYPSTAELYEFIDGKWVFIEDKKAIKLIFG